MIERTPDSLVVTVISPLGCHVVTVPAHAPLHTFAADLITSAGLDGDGCDRWAFTTEEGEVLAADTSLTDAGVASSVLYLSPIPPADPIPIAAADAESPSIRAAGLRAVTAGSMSPLASGGDSAQISARESDITPVRETGTALPTRTSLTRRLASSTARLRSAAGLAADPSTPLNGADAPPSELLARLAYPPVPFVPVQPPVSATDDFQVFPRSFARAGTDELRRTGKVLWRVTMSLDGFIAGPENAGEWAPRSAVPDEFIAGSMATTGALLVGGRSNVRRRSERCATKPALPEGKAWSGRQFVLTDEPPEATDDPTVTFLSGDIDDAVAVALDAAGGKDLVIVDPDIARQCIGDGLLDEILVYLVPVLLGGGVRLFDQPGDPPVPLETVRVTPAGQATLIRFRVVRSP